MARITIRDLQKNTGEWVRKVGNAGSIVVMDRNRAVAKLVPIVNHTSYEQGRPFSEHPLVKGFTQLPKILHDSTRFIAEDRPRA